MTVQAVDNPVIKKSRHLPQFPPAIQLALTLHFLRHVINQRKAPSSTLAWLFIVVLQPYIGLPLYLLLGSRKIHLTKRKLSIPHSVNLIDIQDPMQVVARASGAPDACENASLKFLTDGKIAFNEMLSMINHATKSIFLEIYIFRDDEVGKEILDALTLKAQAGLDVRILLDSFGALLSGNPSFKKFSEAGGKFVKFMPLLKNPFRGSANLRNHRKVLVIDTHSAMTGGMNIASEYMGPIYDSDRWLDQAMIVKGPMVVDICKLFLQDWAFASDLDEEELPLPFEGETQGHLTQLIASGPDLDSDPIYEWLLTAIYTAKKSIWITTPYFIPDESLGKALELAAKRGLDVRLVIPKKSNHLVADLARSTYLEQLEDAGGKILHHQQMIHAKVTLIDQKYGFAGSANMDARSLLLNYELGIAIYSEEDIAQLHLWFEKLFPRCSEGIVRKPAIHAWVGSIARLMSPLL